MEENMGELQEIRTYGEFKAATDREVYNQAEGFVRLGYLLRKAEDTDILKESGYRTVTEFAKAEYGLTETYVSRYISINRRYSEGGYSDRLQEKFKGFGLAKLADMLTLTDQIVDAIPVDATRAEIQEIKREVADEQRVSDLEVLAEIRDRQQVDVLTEALKAFYYGNPEEYKAVHKVLQDMEGLQDGDTWKRFLSDVMEPSGNAVKMMRVPGVGRLILTLRGTDRDAELLNVRSGEKASFSWEGIYERLKGLYQYGQDAEKVWESIYCENYPKSLHRESVKTQPEKQKRKTGAVVSIARAREEKKEEIKIAEDKIEDEGSREEEKEIAPVQDAEPESKPEAVEDREKEKEEGQVPEDGVPKADKIGYLEDSKKLKETVLPKESERMGNKESHTIEPGEDMEERKERQQRKQEEKAERTVLRLKEEAAELLELIRKSLEKNYYNMAKINAKKLIEVVEAMRLETEKKGIPGQQEMKDFFIGQQDGEKEAEN